MKHLTSFKITKKPGPMALCVETDPFTIKSNGATWKAERQVNYTDEIVDVWFVIRGQQGQQYEMEITINGKTEPIEGPLPVSGKNLIHKPFLMSIFFLDGEPRLAAAI